MSQKEEQQLNNLAVQIGVIEERQVQFSKNQEDMQLAQKDMHEKVDKLYFHIIGDKATNTKGIVEEVQGYEVRLNRLERIYLALAFIGSLIFMLKDYIWSIFTKQ